MANRPIFISVDTFPYVEEKDIEFEWFPGFSKIQAQKSIKSLHSAAAKKGFNSILEISTKSPLVIGVELSAFNLKLMTKGNRNISLECAFQGSKVFEYGGPYKDLYSKSSKEAKTDERLKNSGKLIGFDYFGDEFPTKPLTGFYDWLYITAIYQRSDLLNQLLKFNAFTDIAFNPKKSINCQARSAALFVSLFRMGMVEDLIVNRNSYFNLISGTNSAEIKITNNLNQLGLF